MKLITALLFSGLTGLLPCILSADEAAPNVAVDQDADGALAKLAAATRDAVFMLQVGNGPSSYGVFISADGLALVNPQSLLLKRKPKIVAADDKIVKFGKILGMFPEQELVLMKFDHRPKAFVPLAPVEPALGESIALVPLNRERPWKGEIPIVVGPIIAKRSSTTPNLRVARFTKIVSIGTGLSFKQRRALGPGCFATDRKGQLVAFTNSFSRERGQTLITLAPIVALPGKINELTKGGIHLGFPIPDSKNPYDLAAIDPGFHPMNLAMIHQNWTEFERLLKGLQKRYPNSDMLKSKYISLKLALWEGGVRCQIDARSSKARS